MPSEFDLFAPAFDPNDPASVAVWEAWKRRNLAMTRPLVEETRTPVAGLNTGDPRGMVDPEALKAQAQGIPYDIDARRNAIAAQVQAQQQAAAAAAAQQQPQTGGGMMPWQDPFGNEPATSRGGGG
jgi:hypothetical protein